MTYLNELVQWIAENESLLNGLAALVVLIGVILSPLGKGVRQLIARREGRQPDTSHSPSSASVDAVSESAQMAGPLLAEPSEPLLAVLAFDNLSNDPELQFFSDGVSEEIIQRLARGASLKVMGRASSFQFRGADKARAAQQLNCSHVLDGAIRRAENRVRISAHLVDAASNTTLWSDSYDRDLADMFSLQDEISEKIATALNSEFDSFSSQSVDPAIYDLYLRASPRSYAPEELRTDVELLVRATRDAPGFAEAWGRLAYLRAWLHFYQPYAERPASATLVKKEANRALDLDPRNINALTAQLFVVPPFGHFVEAWEILQRLIDNESTLGAWPYAGWNLRSFGFIREGLEQTERAYRLDTLNPMTSNLVALARMAAGRVADAVPVYEDLVERVPEMSFPVTSLLRAYAFQEDWAAVDTLLAKGRTQQLREFQDTLPFIEAKRDPSPESRSCWLEGLSSNVERTGCVDVSRLVYSAHLGLIDEAFEMAATARLGPTGASGDIMGPDAYRTSLMFQATMPELRNDRRFPALCARLGLVEFWITSGKWPDCADEVPYDFRAECETAKETPREPFAPLTR
jgi:TolB-like protein/tetratricopeptide (TPR) repeat protein